MNGTFSQQIVYVCSFLFWYTRRVNPSEPLLLLLFRILPSRRIITRSHKGGVGIIVPKLFRKHSRGFSVF